MNATDFRRLISEAIASRTPLDSVDLAHLASETGDEEFWQSQVRLDRAIREWNARGFQPVPRSSSRGRRFAMLFSAAAIVMGAVWVARPVETAAPGAPESPKLTATPPAEVSPHLQTVPDGRTGPDGQTGPDLQPEPVFAPASTAMASPLVAPRPGNSRRLAEATATAERLAYAFQPVGEQVGSVVRLLIDSVPGADVFSL